MYARRFRLRGPGGGIGVDEFRVERWIIGEYVGPFGGSVWGMDGWKEWMEGTKQ